MANPDKLSSDVKLYIPVSPKKKDVQIYSYSEKKGEVIPLKAQTFGNIYCVTNSGSGYITVAAGVGQPDIGEKKTDTKERNEKKIKIGQIAKSGKWRYKITKADVRIGNTVKIYGRIFKITAIQKNSFSGYRHLKKVIIGKNVKKIGSHAFSNCKKLKYVIVKTESLTKKSVGAGAFKRI